MHTVHAGADPGGGGGLSGHGGYSTPYAQDTMGIHRSIIASQPPPPSMVQYNKEQVATHPAIPP